MSHGAIPSRKWPLIWICPALCLTIASFIDATTDREADAQPALRSAISEPPS